MSQYQIQNNTYLLSPRNDSTDRIDVEVGDIHSKDFIPQTKIKRWDNEVNVSLRLLWEDLSTHCLEEDGVKFETDKLDCKFYDCKLVQDLPTNDGYEFEIILKERPVSSVILFSLSAKNAIFYYQPELTQKEIDEGCIRPDEVVGSYAVYHSGSPINYVGGKKYRTGKVGHIYRPKLVDAKGNCSWGHLNITDTFLTVTIDEDFLENATYPIKHAAGLTFGYTTKGGTYAGRGNLDFCGSWATATAGTINSITWYFKQYSANTPTIKCALYSRTGDITGSFVTGSNTPEWTLTAGWDNWKLFNCSSPPVLSAGDYWIIKWHRPTDVYVHFDSASAYKSGSKTIAWGDFPSTFSWSQTNRIYSCYATYAPFNASWARKNQTIGQGIYVS